MHNEAPSLSGTLCCCNGVFDAADVILEREFLPWWWMLMLAAVAVGALNSCHDVKEHLTRRHMHPFDDLTMTSPVVPHDVTMTSPAVPYDVIMTSLVVPL